MHKNAPLILKSQPIPLPNQAGHFWEMVNFFSATHYSPMNRISPKKLLLSKWTAVHPIAKQKHFLVSKVILPDEPEQAIEFVELEAVYSKQSAQISWRELLNSDRWIQGWK